MATYTIANCDGATSTGQRAATLRMPKYDGKLEVVPRSTETDIHGNILEFRVTTDDKRLAVDLAKVIGGDQATVR